MAYFTLIYSSTDPSEQKEIPQIIIDMSNHVRFFIFKCIYILLKTLADNSFHLS